ncbi:MAG: HAD-IC family P-type ATPase [Patescibacteria group bacterium]|nr:HAD-IC family P-type ATPase [Patescibacteria group bacterium]
MSDSWHTYSFEKVFEELHSRESGLDASEVDERIKKVGPNALPEPRARGLVSIFFAQFASPLIYILLAAALVVLYIGETADAIIIGVVLVFNAVVGSIQEGKAQNTLRALRQYIRGSATVVREGKVYIISDSETVPGDVIVLHEGEKVPADARIFFEKSLRVDESTLTGESVPVGKVSDTLSNSTASVSDRRNMVWRGTNVVAGMGKAVVVATGISTEIGKISKEIVSVNTDVPLKRNVASLSNSIIIAVFVLSVALFWFGVWRGESAAQMLATVVSLAVSVIPEGLPIVLTLVLASGVWRMSKRQVLVKKLQAVEGLGQAKIIAVDKTGTLTKNELVIEKVHIDGITYHITGNGYEPEGDVSRDGEILEPLNHPSLMLMGRIASLCTNATAMYVESEKLWKVSGDPTEAALGVFGKKIGYKDIEEEAHLRFEIPFDYSTKYHLTIHEWNKKNLLTVVGAPEQVLELSNRIWTEEGAKKIGVKERETIENTFAKLSGEGYRVLACAMRERAMLNIENGVVPPLVFVGFFAMRDPLRESVKDAVLRAEHAGIRVVMITGDHKITAHAIAKEAGILKSGEEVLTGKELDELPEEELLRRFDTVSVFARVTPGQKLRIIEIFKKRGEIIAMTGDGVNDAPSLAAADLGVAMGIIGTEVAKEASDLVLLDDNFGNIISAVEEGRSIYRTIQKVVLYLFSTSTGEVLVIIGSLALQLPLPILPAQIIWLNLVTDGFLDVALAMEPKEKNLLVRGFRKPSRFILDKHAALRMVFMGVIIAGGTLLIFSSYLKFDSAKALTVSLTTLAVFQWFNAWNCRSTHRSAFSGFFENRFLVGATVSTIALQLVAIYHPTFQKLLHTVPLGATEWTVIVIMAGTLLVFEEGRKWIVRSVFMRRESYLDVK